MNEKTPDRPSAVIDLGLSHHYVQVLKISVIYHTEIKRHFREDKVWEFLYLIKQVTWQTVQGGREVSVLPENTHLRHNINFKLI